MNESIKENQENRDNQDLFRTQENYEQKKKDEKMARIEKAKGKKRKFQQENYDEHTNKNLTKSTKQETGADGGRKKNKLIDKNIHK